MTKNCRKCNCELTTENTKKWMFKNSDYICISCNNIQKTEHRERNRQNYRQANEKYERKFDEDGHIVYYLPKYNYVGITKNLPLRLKTHKYQQNRPLVDNVQILFKTPSRAEARQVESHLHSLGFN